MSERLLVGGEWWGSPVLLLRGTPPSSDHMRGEDPGVQRTIEAIKVAPPGESVKFGRPRWDRDRSEICELPIDGRDDFAVDVELVSYAYAEVGVEEWRCFENPTVKSLLFLVGLRDGEPVAVVAPRKRKSDE